MKIMNKDIRNSNLFKDMNVLSINPINNGGYLAICNSKDNNYEKVVFKIQTEQHRRVFIQELENWCYIRSFPYVLPILDFGFYDGLYYIVMPYCNIEDKGISNVRDVIYNSSNTVQENITLFYKIMLILDEIKSKCPDFVHGDLKPENFLFMHNMDTIFITDFGSSKVFGKKENKDDTTYPYKAPELWKESRYYTESADVYALGIILFELLFKKHPISNDKKHHDMAEWIRLYCNYDKAFDISDKERMDYKDIIEVIDKCLENQPEKRPTIHELTKIIGLLIDDKIKENVITNFKIYKELTSFVFGKIVLSDNNVLKKFIQIQEYRKAIDIINNKNIPVKSFYTHLAFGIWYDEIGEGDKSFEHLLSAMHLSKSTEDLIIAMNNIALVFKHAGQYEISQSIYFDILSYTATLDSPNFISNIATIYIDKGDYDYAEKLLNNALRINPESEIIWRNLLNIYEKKGDKKKMEYAFICLDILDKKYI